jgi:Zn finger protein HypA/HybF involved in hydrogenase expression
MNLSNNPIDRLKEANDNASAEAMCFDCKWEGTAWDVYKNFIENDETITIKYHCPKCKSQNLGVKNFSYKP